MAPRCGRPRQPHPHTPWTRSIVSPCTPNRPLGSVGPGSSPACPRAAPRAVSCPLHPAEPRAAQPRGIPISSIPGGLSPTAPCPPRSGAGQGAAPPSCPQGHIHPLLAAGAGAGWDLSAWGSWSSPSVQLFQGTSMAVTSSRRVYNPAMVLGSLGCAGGRLGCRSAGAWCCQHPDAGVSHTPRYPWGGLSGSPPRASPWKRDTGTRSWRRSTGAVPIPEVWEVDGQTSPSPPHQHHWLRSPTCKGVE